MAIREEYESTDLRQIYYLIIMQVRSLTQLYHTCLSNGSREEFISLLFYVVFVDEVDEIIWFLDIERPGTRFSCWLSVSDWSEPVEARPLLGFSSLPLSSKPAKTGQVLGLYPCDPSFFFYFPLLGTPVIRRHLLDSPKQSPYLKVCPSLSSICTVVPLFKKTCKITGS